MTKAAKNCNPSSLNKRPGGKDVTCKEVR